VNYVERHFGDWARDTVHLSMLEDGAYNRLCDLYYVREAPLPAEVAACCRLARATSTTERGAVKSVLAEFFELTADGWRHKRCDLEIERFRSRSDKAKGAAAVSVAARRAAAAERNDSERSTNAERTLNERSTNAERTLERTLNERSTNAERTLERTLNERSTNVEQRTRAGARPSPLPTSHSPLPSTLFPDKLETGSGPAQSAAPPSPSTAAEPPEAPEAFDGRNAESLNGKAIVPIAAAFALPAQWGLDAEALGFNVGEVTREAEKFRQYWTDGRGKGTRRSVRGWRQSWSTWLDKASKDKR
jgi:uncharacterized protein YdaU (DUF1376 family)